MLCLADTVQDGRGGDGGMGNGWVRGEVGRGNGWVRGEVGGGEQWENDRIQNRSEQVRQATQERRQPCWCRCR